MAGARDVTDQARESASETAATSREAATDLNR